MYQKVTAIGRIANPDVRTNQKGNTFIRFGLAVQEKRDEEPTWLNCILGGRFAETMQDKLQKGQLVFIEGKLSIRQGQDRNGNDQTYTNIMVDQLRILKDPENNNGSNSAPQQDEELDDDIPF